ncbi:stAR-related lipid transfer protein 9-like [Acipenser oxyrinchus oxyrinchus]|uniref:StAR-related lipid transfer protein 9-like n=1 Tax=Acipenser oxyrinchus oxyrinchus TaxID=40147 RepID=A0AAD8FWU0_ACIOX|nr:stAR-related lipid transfer protein 9-like [Acipenser oxyrinchus oxyrinchus]
MDSSLCCLKQPRDFCCISAESKQEEQFVLALRSVYDEALPRPGRELVRGEVLPSAWVLQPDTQHRKEVTKVVYMTQVDLGTPALPQRLLGFVAKRQAMVIANLASFFPL